LKYSATRAGAGKYFKNYVKIKQKQMNETIKQSKNYGEKTV